MLRVLPICFCLLAISPLRVQADPLVHMVLQEAANEPLQGLIAVAAVAVDRASDSRWPDSTRDVIYQPWQFTGMRVPMRKYSPNQIARAKFAVSVALTGYRPCGRALWYHADYVQPNWSKRFNVKCKIGRHIFYGD